MKVDEGVWCLCLCLRLDCLPVCETFCLIKILRITTDPFFSKGKRLSLRGHSRTSHHTMASKTWSQIWVRPEVRSA